jgi:hypothetical protein
MCNFGAMLRWPPSLGVVVYRILQDGTPSNVENDLDSPICSSKSINRRVVLPIVITNIAMVVGGDNTPSAAAADSDG